LERQINPTLERRLARRVSLRAAVGENGEEDLYGEGDSHRHVAAVGQHHAHGTCINKPKRLDLFSAESGY